MASTSGIEELTKASAIIGTVCKTHGCVYARARTGYGEKEAPFECRVKYDNHVIVDFSGDGCKEAGIAGPSSDTVIPGTMTREGFTQNTEKPETYVGHFDKVYGSHFTYHQPDSPPVRS